MAMKTKTKERWKDIGSMAFGPAGMLWRSQKKKRQAAEAEQAAALTGIEEQIAGMPTYEIAPEIEQQLAMLEESAEGVRGTTALAEEATDIARARTGRAEMPGEGLARRDIQQQLGSNIQNIVEAGGGGVGALGAIAQAGLGAQGAYGQLAQQRAQFSSQAEQDLANALRAEAGFTAGAEMQAAGLEAQGLSAMAGERGKAYESELSKSLTGTQFDIDQFAAMRAEEQARRDRNAQIASAIIGAGASVGKSALTGGMG